MLTRLRIRICEATEPHYFADNSVEIGLRQQNVGQIVSMVQLRKNGGPNLLLWVNLNRQIHSRLKNPIYEHLKGLPSDA